MWLPLVRVPVIVSEDGSKSMWLPLVQVPVIVSEDLDPIWQQKLSHSSNQPVAAILNILQNGKSG
jgi:hypothetical protein